MARRSCIASFLFLITLAAVAAQNPPPNPFPDDSTDAVYPSSRTYRLSLSFERKTLENAIESISRQIRVPIAFERQDLLREGITRNQSFGLDESSLSVDELLRKCLLRCSPDGKLAFVLRTDERAGKTIFIVTRHGALERNEVIFPEFSVGVRLTSRNYKLPISFDRDSLQGAIERISREIGVPFELEANDLRAAGFAPGQSHGLQETELTVEALLQKFLLRCNPDDQLAYVVRKDSAGKQKVVIVTRKGAAERGETLFPEFVLGTLRTVRETDQVDDPWSTCVRAATLEREVVRQIDRLGDALKTATPERASAAAVAELAALFRVIEQYDGDVRGKREARAMWETLGRNLPSRKAWDENRRRQVVALYDDLRNWIASDKWLRVGESARQISAAQAAPRSELMQRLQFAVDGQLKPGDGTATESAVLFDEVRHEAEIIRLIGRTVRHSSYEFADDRHFVDFAKALKRQATAVIAAAEKKDLPQVRIEINRLRVRCDDCHGGYR